MIGNHVATYRIIGTYPHAGYRAIDLVDGTRVHLDLADAHTWRETTIQHLRAASIVGSLDHPGIARIHGRGVLPDLRPYVASELADGIPLCDVLARRALAVDETVALVRDLCEIAAHAHARRIVHGAIHAHRVVLRTGETPFPIQLGGWADLELAGDAADGKRDVHAIGALAYRGLTGRDPGAHAPELVAGVPGPVSALVVRMLADDPARRPSALAALGEAAQLTGDRVLSGPRFARPRWTPLPLPDGERIATIGDLAAARRTRS